MEAQNDRKEQKKDEKKSESVDSHSPYEMHIAAGEFVKSAVYGGLDGLCTTLIICLSGIGSTTTANTVVAVGIASMIADGLSMGVADYLATKSDGQYMKEEEIRELAEIESDFEAEKRQMIEIYKEMGLEPKVADEIVQILSTNKEGFLKVMMIQELQLIADEENPFLNSIVTFFSFVIFGVFPLIPFIIAKAKDLEVDTGVIVATIVVSIFFLGVLGVAKSCVTSQTAIVAAIETIIIGAIASSAAFGIGRAFGEG